MKRQNKANKGSYRPGEYTERQRKATAAFVKKWESMPEKRCVRCLAVLGFGGKMIARLVPVFSKNACIAQRKKLGLENAKSRNQLFRHAILGTKPNKPRKAEMYKAAAVGRHQRDAWRGEWTGVARWDEARHWLKHPERLRCMVRALYQSRSKAKTNYHIATILRTRIYCVLKGIKKSKPTEQMLGCTWQQLREYLQAQFTIEMTWENHGKVWHIDHIHPCDSFDLSDQKQQAICFHYTNLRPLIARENRVKRCKITEPQMGLTLGFVPIRTTAHTNRRRGAYQYAPRTLLEGSRLETFTAGPLAGVQIV